MDQLKAIYEAVLDGDASATGAGVEDALAASLPAERILKEGLIGAMAEVGRLFEEGDYFVPEMLIAARAMQQGLNLLKPHLAADEVVTAGKVVVGTVQGDLHDIGKNLVAMMLEGAGFEIVDLGTDVSPESFVEAVREHQPGIVGMSALLTTTMPSMKQTVEALEEAGLRQMVKVMIGGAPVTDAYAQKISADGFAPDAGSAVRLAQSLVDGVS